jgi:Cu/Ag efflux protein CusF
MNRRFTAPLVAVAFLGAVSAVAVLRVAQAQPAKGAPAAFERVREVMNNRFKDMKLTGDPDRDFAAVLIAHHEDLIFLAKTQLEHGGDRQMRQLAQKILDEQQKQISELKEWQVRSRQADYKAQPDQPPPGSGPLDQKAQAAGPAAPATAPAQSAQAAAPASPATAPAQTAQAAAPAAAAAPATPAPSAPAALSAVNLPMVPATVEKVDAGQGKITLDHGPIPNLNMDAMTMVFRAGDPTMLKSVRQGDKVQFQADRVNGQITVTKIQKGR